MRSSRSAMVARSVRCALPGNPLSAAALSALRTLARGPADPPALPAHVAGEVRGVMTTYLAHLLGRPLRVPATLTRGGRRASRP